MLHMNLEADASPQQQPEDAQTPLNHLDGLDVLVICMYIYIYIHMNIYIYRERERERDRARETDYQ